MSISEPWSCLHSTSWNFEGGHCPRIPFEASGNALSLFSHLDCENGRASLDLYQGARLAGISGERVSETGGNAELVLSKPGRS
jgi:hypothetical protein